MTPEQRLHDLGLILPEAPAVAGNYVPWVKSGSQLHLSGALAVLNGQMTHTGKVGEVQTVETAYQAARNCTLNLLANIKAATGSLDAVKQVVFVCGYVNGVSGFADSPAVLNGASDLLAEVFGEAGKHARAAVAVAGLPKDSSVEVSCIVELLPGR